MSQDNEHTSQPQVGSSEWLDELRVMVKKADENADYHLKHGTFSDAQCMQFYADGLRHSLQWLDKKFSSNGKDQP